MLKFRKRFLATLFLKVIESSEDASGVFDGNFDGATEEDDEEDSVEETTLSYKVVFLRCVELHGDPLYKHLPTEDDWTFATKICEKLNLFYKMIEDFSGINIQL
ncbi:hypothetical protein V6N12_058195 [Hibiscus sabdariffa]|uniref:Uncharacterized protein n=1 Tax=Hibiscus sabdariffa TaxID=183260 RepID=A0ABR2ERF7_9ROSI